MKREFISQYDTIYTDYLSEKVSKGLNAQSNRKKSAVKQPEIRETVQESIEMSSMVRQLDYVDFQKDQQEKVQREVSTEKDELCFRDSSQEQVDEESSMESQDEMSIEEEAPCVTPKQLESVPEESVQRDVSESMEIEQPEEIQFKQSSKEISKTET